MFLKIEYEYTFDMRREVVWRLIQEKEVLQRAIPGCQSFEQVEEGVFRAEMDLSVGPVKGLFTGEVQQADQQEPSYYRLLVRGKGKAGEIDAIAEMNLDEVEGGVKLTCMAEVQVTGVLASVGQRVMGGVARLVLGQFFKTADKEMKQLASQP
jgi:carbon monoxide dehydrogenase subunit G